MLHPHKSLLSIAPKVWTALHQEQYPSGILTLTFDAVEGLVPQYAIVVAQLEQIHHGVETGAHVQVVRPGLKETSIVPATFLMFAELTITSAPTITVAIRTVDTTQYQVVPQTSKQSLVKVAGERIPHIDHVGVFIHGIAHVAW